MKLIIVSLCLLWVSFVSPFPEQRESSDGVAVVSTKTADSIDVNDDEVKLLIVVQRSDDVSETESKTSWNRRGVNKRIRNHFNRHSHKGVRHYGRKRGSSKEKKGVRKHRYPVSPIQYFNRSSHTDQLNNALDQILENFCHNLNEDNSLMTIKLDYFQKTRKMTPWTFVVLDRMNVTKGETNKLDEITRQKRFVIFEQEGVEPDLVDGEQEEDEEEEEIVTEDEKSSSNSTELPEVPLSESKQETKDSDDDEDDDDDDEEENGFPANVSHIETTNSLQIRRIKDPSPVVLPGGMVEYNLQVLNEDDLQQAKEQLTEEHSTSSEQHDDRRQSRKYKKNKKYGRRYSRKLIAKVEGMDKMKRMGDTMIGMRENSTARIIDTQVKIGPIQFIIDDERAGLIQHTRVSSSPLTARLRLTEVDGNLVSVRFKPTKIQNEDVFVTLRLKENGQLPASSELGKVVNFLSQEMNRAWNSGYLLRRLKRRFKKLYIQKADDRKIISNLNLAHNVVHILALSTVDDQPTTATPITHDNDLFHP